MNRKEKIKEVTAEWLTYLEAGRDLCEKVKYVFYLVLGMGLLTPGKIDIAGIVLLGIGALAGMALLGKIYTKGHVGAAQERFRINYMTEYAKQNYDVQQQILKELRKLNGRRERRKQ